LLCSEAAGIPDATGYIVSEALVDYDQYYELLNLEAKVRVIKKRLENRSGNSEIAN
jgi:hypothetical protein